MTPMAELDRQLNSDDDLARLLSDVFPPIEVRSPLYETLGVRLREQVGLFAALAPADNLPSAAPAPVAPVHRSTPARSAAGMLAGWRRIFASWWYRPILAAAVATVAFLAIASLLAPRSQTPTPVTALLEAALLEIKAGTATVRSAGHDAATLRQGDRVDLKAGDIVETDGDGRALITYLPGQTSEIGAQSQLQIVSVATVGKETTIVRARLLHGSTTNRLSNPLTPGSSFTLESPSLTAAAHGTEFRMITLSPTQTYLATDQGQVQIERAGLTTLVAAGQQALAKEGQDVQVTAQPASQDVWIVQPGDVLWQIARRYGLTAQDVADANPWLTNLDLILPGWRLIIPAK